MSQEKIDKIKIHNETQIKGFFNEYRWLSNFHLCDVWYEGLCYPSSENAYQAAKLYPEERMEFVSMTPLEAMKEGRKRHSEENIEDWMGRRVDVMHQVLFDKFKNPVLRQMLIATDEKYLEETNWWNDVFWGVCDGVGESMLGKILMSIRYHFLYVESIKQSSNIPS